MKLNFIQSLLFLILNLHLIHTLKRLSRTQISFFRSRSRNVNIMLISKFLLRFADSSLKWICSQLDHWKQCLYSLPHISTVWFSCSLKLRVLHFGRLFLCFFSVPLFLDCFSTDSFLQVIIHLEILQSAIHFTWLHSQFARISAVSRSFWITHFLLSTYSVFRCMRIFSRGAQRVTRSGHLILYSHFTCRFFLFLFFSCSASLFFLFKESFQ